MKYFLFDGTNPNTAYKTVSVADYIDKIIFILRYLYNMKTKVFKNIDLRIFFFISNFFLSGYQI